MSKRGNGEGSIYSREQRRTNKDGTITTKTIWCTAVSMDFGKRRVIYGSTREEVAAELVKVLGARQVGLPIPGTRLKTREYLETWLEDTVKPSRKPLTYERYESSIRMHVLPAIAKLPLSRVGPEHVQRIQAQMLAKGLSPATIIAMRTALGAALTQAERWHLVARNAVRLVDPPRADDTEPRVLEPHEAAALLQAARGDEMEYLFATMLATGLRSGEARGLRWADVHLNRPSPVIEVRQQVLELKDQTSTKGRRRAQVRVFDVPKSGHGRRAVPLIPAAVSALQAQRERLAELPLRGVQDLVFPGVDGQALVAHTVRDHFLRIAVRAGIQGATPHTLRHSTGTYLLAVGVPDRVVQDILGHGSAAMTRLYQHVTPSMLVEAGEALAGFWNRVATPVATS